MMHPEDTSTAFAQRKVVRFPSDQSIAQFHDDETCMSDEEKLACWYQPREFMQIRNEIEATLLELMQIEEDLVYWDTSKYTLRGIEQHFSSRYRSQRREMHKTRVRMVLKAQKECGHSGEEAQRRIRRISKICSKASRTRAQEVGALDQFAAGLGRPTTQGSLQQNTSPIHKPLVDGSPTRRPSLIAQQA